MLYIYAVTSEDTGGCVKTLSQLTTTAVYNKACPPTSIMMSRHRTAACCWALLSWISFASVFVTAQQQPDSVVTSFSNLPNRLFFFDDTDVCNKHMTYVV